MMRAEVTCHVSVHNTMSVDAEHVAVIVCCVGLLW